MYVWKEDNTKKTHVTNDIYKSPKNATILSHVGKRM